MAGGRQCLLCFAFLRSSEAIPFSLPLSLYPPISLLMEDGEINVEETNVGVEKSYFSYIFEVKRKEEKRTENWKILFAS